MEDAPERSMPPPTQWCEESAVCLLQASTSTSKQRQMHSLAPVNPWGLSHFKTHAKLPQNI